MLSAVSFGLILRWIKQPPLVGYILAGLALGFPMMMLMGMLSAGAFGGTITGEHGIGLAKKEFLPKFAGAAQMRVMRELRKALDPKGILNPGKMFD